MPEISSVIVYNLSLLYRIWRQERSGQLRLVGHDPRDRTAHMIPIAQGGLVDKGMWPILLQTLPTHAFALDERPTDSIGNRKLMGALILSACRKHRVSQSVLLDEERSYEQPGSPPQLSLMPAITLPPFLLFPESAPSESRGLQDLLLTQGRAQLEGGAFAEADVTLSAARDLRMDHAPTQALLAMARFQNPHRPKAERVRDAESMTRLAWLLAQDDPDVARAHDMILGAIPRVIDGRRAEGTRR